MKTYRVIDTQNYPHTVKAKSFISVSGDIKFYKGWFLWEREVAFFKQALSVQEVE